MLKKDESEDTKRKIRIFAYDFWKERKKKWLNRLTKTEITLKIVDKEIR